MTTSNQPAVDSEPRKVTVENFPRAETDLYFADVVHVQKGWSTFFHIREPMPIDNQTVIRANRDTLYSGAVFDLDAGPVTVTLPDAEQRFMSLFAVSEDHYVQAVVYGVGDYTFTRDQIGTRYVLLGVRTLVDPADPADIERVHVLQDGIGSSQSGSPRFEVPTWDLDGQKRIREALVVLGATLPDLAHAFGTKEEVDPVRHLIGSAIGWGGNPDKDAMYLNVTPSRNDGTVPYELTVGDVPVDAFWSISVYNANGYYEPNDANAYTLNNLTAERNGDSTITIRFGGSPTLPNVLPISPGWNYMVRMYRPRAEVLDGTWTFPEAMPTTK